MDRQNVILSYNGILLKNKSKQATDTCYNIADSQNCMLDEGKQTQKTMYRLIPCEMEILEKAKL
jgi:hypothetical protein